MKIESALLIAEMLQLTEKSTTAARKLLLLSDLQLNFKENPDTWSILECIEHLNRYGDYYLPEIQSQILAQKAGHVSPIFKTGLLGNYFAGLMQVQNGKMKKMKSPKDKNPSHSTLTRLTIDRFLKQQELLQSLLLQSKRVDLQRTKTAISLSKLIRLRLGDTFRFFVYHIERHVLQAERICLTANFPLVGA